MEHYFNYISKQEAINLTIVELSKLTEFLLKARENPDVLNLSIDEIKKYHVISCEFSMDFWVLINGEKLAEKAKQEYEKELNG